MSHQDYNRHQQQQPIQQHDTSHSQQDYSLQTHILLAHSWLLVLVVAPLTISLLIWVLVLLVRQQRRRRRQDEKRAQILHKSLALLVGSEGRQTECNIPTDTSHHKEQSKYGNKRNRTSKQSNNAADQLLLDLTTSSSSTTSTNTSTSSAASTVQAGQLNPNDQDHNHHHHHVHHLEHDENHLQNQQHAELAQARQLGAWHRSFNAYRDLIDQTQCYLITLTSQEILACLVAFSLAILNIIRTRNLFSCNLVIFALIATKLLSLLSLATFTFAKLIRLLRLRAPPVACATATTTTTTTTTTASSHRHHNDHQKSCQGCRKLQFPAVIQPVVGSRAASRGQLKLDIIGCISEESSLDPQSLNPDAQGSHSDRSPRGAGNEQQQQLTDEQQATISRLLVGHSSSANGAACQLSGTSKLSSSLKLHPADDFARSPSNQLLMSALRVLEGKNADLTSGPAAAEIFKDKPAKKSRASTLVLALLSSALALFCLYMRLVGVPSSDHQPSQHLNHLHLMPALNRNLTDWAISISTYPTITLSATGGAGGGGGGSRSTSTTTEASTRYESTSGDGLDGTASVTSTGSNSSEAVHLVQAASLSSLQQTTSQLRHLIDAHELHTFAQLLLDTQLQTSRFSCNLSSGNYAPLARSTMLTIYLGTLAIVALIGTLIQRVGRRKMKQFLLASQMQLTPETATGGRQQQQQQHRSLFQALPSQLLSRHHHDSIQATNTNQIINQSMENSLLKQQQQQRKLSGGSSGGGAPLSLFGRQNSQRYSDLLKQNLRHHQSLAELASYGGVNGSQSSSLLAMQNQHKQRRRLLMREQRQQHKLARNASSMSSLLFGLTNSSSGTADNRASRKLTATKRHLLAAGHRPVECEKRHHMRRLAVSQPSNLNALGRQQVTTAAQKLAWLPQGSGAGVAASLYQIEANTSQRTSSPPNESFELTNLISKGSRGLGGGGGMGAHFPPITSNQTRSSASNKAKNQGQQSACVAMRAGLPRAHQARGKIGITSTSTPASKSTSTSSAAEQEHRELKQDLSLTKSIILFAQLLNHGPVLLMLAIGTFLPDGIVGGSGQQQQQVDGLQEQPATEAATSGGGGTGWTGVHDNAFAWLMLVEALAWPLLLCASDTQIAHAFRRSLRASSCTPPATATVAQCSPPGAPLSSAAAHATSAHQTSRLSLANGAASELGATGDFKHKQWPLQFAVASQQQRLNQSSAGGCGGHRLLRNHSHKQINLAGSRLDFLGNGKRAAGGHDDHAQYHKHLAPRGANFANSANNYLLGPSSTYPNFMFAFGGVSGSKQPPGHLGRATFAASASGTEIYSQPPANGQRVALAGELGLLTTAVNDRFEANGSIRESSPNLYDQLDATAAGATCWPPVIRGDHQNLARYDSDQTRYLASRKASSNLLINVGRRLFKLGRRRDRRGRRVSSGAKMSDSGAFGTGTSANTDLADGSGARGGGDHQPASKRIRRSSELSPTSSLSTLIRKFNHDNYTSVCKQYENHNIIIANENNNNNKRRPDMASEQVAAPIEAGDTGESGASKTTSADHEIISLAGETTCDGALAVEQRICARKGGLAYEFSLNDGRINPMLATTTSIGSGTRKQRDSGVKQQVVTSNGQPSSSNLMAVSDKMARLLDIDVAVVSGDRNLQNTAGKTRQSSPLVEDIQQPANGRADANRNQKPLATVVSGSANDKVATELEQTSTPLAKQTANEDAEEQRRRRPPSGGASSKPKMPLVSANLPQVATGHGNDQDSSAVATKPQQQQQQRPPSPPESKQTSAAAPAAELQANSNNYLNQMQLRLQQFEDNETAAADAVTCVDYATLRSLDDALSLVSVSSEFEYHDIGRLGAPFAQTSSSSSAGVCRVESTPAAGQIEMRKAQHRPPQANESEHLVVKEPPKEGATSSSSSISNQRPTTAASKQADDLRFPSFLATPQAPAAQSHAHSTSSSSSQVPNRRPQSTSHSNLVASGSGSRRRPDGGSGESGGGSKQGSARAAQAKISSSLLELTAAKYAGSGAQKPAINATPVGTNGTNSSTITKSRAAQKSSPSLVQFGEFTRNRSGSSVALGVFATGASRNAHDQGNVRARIMRMEQQQHQQHQAEEEQKQRRIQMTGRHHQQVSSPNLTALQLGSGSNRANRVDSSHHKQGPSSSSSSSSTSTASTTASMIPVLASSAGRHHNHVRHTRRVLIVQDETVAGEQNFQGRRPLNGSGESSVDSAYESTEEDEEQDDDLLQEEEFKRRRLIDVADSSTVKAAAGGEGLLAATNSTTTRRRTQETPARASPQDEEGEESPNQVQVHLVKQQQPTTEPSEAGLLAAFFSHIDKQWKFAEIVLIIVISAILNLVTIIGNIMVLISFKMDRSLQTVSNYFLLSLALADLLIGLISMPLYTLYLLLNYWPLGPLMCDIWLAIDYLNSNAAVLNMLIISYDRYFSVTRPLTYRAKRTTKHACLMISFAWLLSLTIWTPAIFTYPYYKGRTVQGTDKCEIEFVKANTYLTFVTAILAFYIPVAIMIYLYWRIWLETKKRYRDLTTLFLVSGVGAAAPTRPRPPAALSGHLTGRAGGGGGDVKHASLWARNLARARLYAPSLMRGPQKAASLTPRASPPLKLCNDQRPPSPPVSAVTGKTGRPAPASLAINEPTPAQVGCDRHASVAGDASKPSKVAVVQAIDSEKVESIRSQPSQQQVPSMPSQLLARHLARQRCKCRSCNSLGQPGQSHGLSPDCKVCARDAMSSISGQGRHKCSASRKGTTCCCCSNSHATGTIVQPHQHNRTKYDFTKLHTTGSCRYCANLSNKLTSRGQRPAVVSHTHSPRAKVARSEGGPDLLQLADDAQPITGKAATFGSRSSLCQRSKIHPKEDAKPGSSDSDEPAAPGTKLLVDVATSPINFSNTSLAPASSSSATHHHHQLDDNVIQQQQQQLGAPLTPVSPEVEDFETRIVSYGHKFHFETDDPKLASKRDQRTNQPGAGGAYNPCHYHHHHQHHNHRKHHQHHNHTQMSSTGWKMPAGGGGGKSAPGKHVGATCCCAEVISAHDAECRFCRPAHRPTTHQQLGTRHAHHHHQHSPAGHAHQHRHHHSHHVHSGHGHHQHHHHNNNHHHHHHHHNHHHSKHTAHKHASPGKQCNKCPQVARSPPARAPTDPTTIERDVALGSSLPILAALQNTHAAAAATNSAKKYGQKLTFSDILMERSSSCVALEQQQRPDKSNSLQVALQVAAAHERQSSPAVSESERELLARRNADRLRSAFEYEAEEEDEDGAISDIEAEGQQGRPNWLMRLLILVGLAAPRSTSRRSASHQANQRRQRPQHVHEPQTTDSSDSSDPQQAKLRSQQQQQQLPQHSSSTKSSSSGSQQHHQVAPSPHATGSERHYNNHSHHHHHHHPIQPKSERKAAKTLSTLLLVFIVTWLPYNVLVLIKTLSGGEDMVPEKIWNFSYYLCYINSTINPLCYALCNAQFRRTYMRILKCKLSNEHNSTRRLVAIQTGAGGGGGSSTAACSTWNKENASRLNSSSLDGAHLLNHSSSGATLGGGGGSGPLAAAGRHRQSSASNGAHRHSGGGDGRRS